MQSIHISVLLSEIVSQLGPQPCGVFVDGTLGNGGHTEVLAKAVLPNGCVIGFDRDVAAIDRTQARLGSLPVKYVHADYRYFPEALKQLGIEAVDGFLLDLGLSSDQLADRSRGFSFDSDGLFDLRFDTSEGQPAFEMLQWMSAEKIADVLYQYGEERNSRSIARAIIKSRENGKPVRTATDFAAIVRRCVPFEKNRKNKIDPATRSFQGFRIAVNDELGALESALKEMPNYLKPSGRIAIISFHSLEDRIVKNAFREDSRLKVITKKPTEAKEAEIDANPRSRSAKLRIAEKL